MSDQSIRVLVVDDSAFARKVVREVLETDPQIEVVGIARDGLEALEKILELKPDVITLDLIMPDLDGLGVLRALPKNEPPRVVIVSVSGSDTELGMEALDLGATEIVAKPTPLPTDRLYELRNELVSKVKAAAIARQRPLLSPRALDPLPKEVEANVGTSLVVIGTSTGGPQALTHLFQGLPPNLPVPIAIALHIPAGYTASMASRLTEIGNMPVFEARDGQELVAGQAVIAPGGKHLRVRLQNGSFLASVSDEPQGLLHRPSVDELFSSAAEQAGHGALGLIMTGMGNDGLLGAESIRKKGGRIFTESEGSCVIYGMPRSVVEAGQSDGEALLPDLAELLVQQIYSGK